jgi:hypothetical protein
MPRGEQDGWRNAAGSRTKFNKNKTNYTKRNAAGGKRGLEGAARQIVQRAPNGRAPAAHRPKYALAAGHDARKNPGAVRARQGFRLLDRRARVG